MQQLTIRVPDEYMAGIKNIATFDKRDFSIYTLPARKKFNLVLDG